MSEKMQCPSCGSQVAFHLAVCPFCGKPVRSPEEIENDPAVKERIAQMAVEQVRSESPSPSSQGVAVRGPVSAFLSLFLPRHRSGAFVMLEWVLAITSIPFIAVNCLIMTFIVKKWGQIPFIDIAFTALLVGIFTHAMENSLYFNVFVVSLISLLLKKGIGLLADRS